MRPLPSLFLVGFLPLDGLKESQRKEVINGTNHFVWSEFCLSPLHFRIPLFILLIFFYFWIYCLSWRFSAEESTTLWEKIGGNPARSFVRLVRSLSLLYAAEHPLVLAQIGAPSVFWRHTHFRNLKNNTETQ